MREFPLSNVEKEFLLGAIAENKRVDGRQPTDFREIRISFGKTYGTCEVWIGQTRVLAHVSGEVGVPKAQRPNEGILHINLELSPMAHPTFEAGRQTEEAVVLNCVLERCLKDSRCVDLESLCIVSAHKVWTMRVDLNVVNHDGNILDCCSIAAMAALKHFRRPDITVKGEEVTIHTADERAPIPLSVHHMPLCVTFAFFHQGKQVLLDPTEREERVLEGRMLIGQNKHREICMMQVTGQTSLDQDQMSQCDGMITMSQCDDIMMTVTPQSDDVIVQVMRCSQMALVKVLEMTELIYQALTNDKAARARGGVSGFAVSEEGRINSTVTPVTDVKAPPPSTHTPSDDGDGDGSPGDSDSDSAEHSDDDDRSQGDGPTRVAEGAAVLGTTVVNQWMKNAH
ncbi:hypothetical protein ACOMHN_007510 [Nucella lapillus]